MSDTTSHGLLDRLFHLTENKTTVKRECLAGLTTFVSMAYILFVNPQILGDAGMDAGAVFTATALYGDFGLPSHGIPCELSDLHRAGAW